MSRQSKRAAFAHRQRRQRASRRIQRAYAGHAGFVGVIHSMTVSFDDGIQHSFGMGALTIEFPGARIAPLDSVTLLPA